MKKIKPIFQCQKCKKIFERDFPWPTLCIYCKHIYVDWLNWEKVIKNLGRYRGNPWVTIDDYINKGE